MIVKVVKTCQPQAKNKKSKTGLQRFIVDTTNNTSKCKTQSAKAGFAMLITRLASFNSWFVYLFITELQVTHNCIEAIA